MTAKALLGNALVFAAVLCEGVYAVVGKKLTGSLGPKRISALINLWGLALVTPFGLWQARDFDFASVALPMAQPCRPPGPERMCSSACRAQRACTAMPIR